MQNRKPLVREAYRVAANDMLPELKKLREEKYRHYDESWVVGVSDLDSPEVRRMNDELGLNTNEGINRWYK
jgi:hypothetical protein